MTPHFGVVPVSVAFVAGVCTLAGLYHLMIAVRKGDGSRKSWKRSAD